MDWYHKSDIEWLNARKDYLSAGDIVKLLPYTATGRPRKNIEDAYFAVWADKQCRVREEDAVSRGVMARGHLFEPYAVAELNSQSLFKGKTAYHWDNTLVHLGMISCSPDALDVAQVHPCPVRLSGIDATQVAEIKSYNAQAHYEAGMAAPGDLVERWQIATAMYTMPTIELGMLVFFNPTARHPIFIVTYERADLDAELTMIDEVADEMARLKPDFEAATDALCATWVCRNEDDIVAELLEATLNP